MTCGSDLKWSKTNKPVKPLLFVVIPMSFCMKYSLKTAGSIKVTVVVLWLRPYCGNCYVKI